MRSNSPWHGVLGLRPCVTRIIVVDDGSTDGTAERARDAGAEILRHEVNRGKGLRREDRPGASAQSDATHVLLLDGDMQHRPDEAVRLLEAAATGADAVLGERQFRREEMPASRYHANRIGSRVLSWFVGVPLHDTQCGFRHRVRDRN